MRVWLDANKLAAFQLTPADVETALRTQNVELPAGRIESQQQNVTLRVDRPFASAESFTRLVVGRGPDGYQVKLGDIAKVEQGAENPYTTFRMNGQSAVGMGIVRQSGANTLAVADAAKKTAAGLDLPEGMTITVGSDDSLFIGRAIEGVWHTLAEAAVLVVLVIFLFLGSWRATLIDRTAVRRLLQQEGGVMNDLLELAERCEKATGPDRDLDALIAVAAGGADSVIGEWSYRYGCARELPWYTSSLDTAMRLVPDRSRGCHAQPCPAAPASAPQALCGAACSAGCRAGLPAPWLPPRAGCVRR